MAARGTITAEIVSIGNSKGLRIPRSLREEIGLRGKVTLSVVGGALVVRPKQEPRAGWRDSFAGAGTRAPDLLIPDEIGNDFDKEWTW